MKYQIKCADPNQRSMFYSCCELAVQKACIGHLRMDFGSGKEFFSTWWDDGSDLNTQAFRDELNNMLRELRFSGLLNNRDEMQRYCNDHESLDLEGSYGFSVETDEYLYLLRCHPVRGNYDCYCYCYNKKKLPQEQP